MIEVGDIVLANASHAGGRPYRAEVEEIRQDKAMIRPLHGERVLTKGSSRPLRRRGPSTRARWVKVENLQATPT